MESNERTKGWQMPDREATTEAAFMARRRFTGKLASASAGLLLGTAAACTRIASDSNEPANHVDVAPTSDYYPAPRNPMYKLKRRLTDEGVAASYNNFYEFTADKTRVHQLVSNFTVYPWQVEITGLVRKPQVFDIDDLMRKMPIEERLYRFRCVEAWAMAVPWTGFVFSALINRVKPLTTAKFVRLLTFYRPEEARAQRLETYWNWPYYEALTMEEACNELTLLATGIYGHELPKQHGAPLRLVVPWKYGYKSIKSIVRIEFVNSQPRTFWSDQAPREYDFWSNVNPTIPHPRWSQASETLVGTGRRVPTRLYNGYEDYVAHLYAPG